MKSGFRHLARQIVVKALFWYSERPESSQEEIVSYLTEHDEGKKLPDTKFTSTTLAGCIENIEAIDALIAEYAPDWPLDKIAKADLMILRLGVFELVYNNTEIPPLVAINEAVELAKEFGEEKSSQFVNGVLSKLAKDKLGSDKLSHG